jgi:hypothetical protein
MPLNLLEEIISRPYYSRLILSEFNKPVLTNIFYINKQGLILNSDIIEFNKQKWLHNPRQFCYDHYEVQELFPLILLVNNISSFFNFIPDNLTENKIYAPEYNFVTSLLDQ